MLIAVAFLVGTVLSLIISFIYAGRAVKNSHIHGAALLQQLSDEIYKTKQMQRELEQAGATMPTSIGGLSKPLPNGQKATRVEFSTDVDQFYEDVVDALPKINDVYYEVEATYVESHLRVDLHDGDMFTVDPGYVILVEAIHFATGKKLMTMPVQYIYWVNEERGIPRLNELMGDAIHRLLLNERARALNGFKRTVINSANSEIPYTWIDL